MTKRKPPSKQSRLKENLTKTILQYVQGKRYSPLTADELMGQLSVAEQHQPLFLSILDELIQEKKIACVRKRYQLNENRTELKVGKISVHPVKGFGFVAIEGEACKDVFIPKPYLNDAVDGDTVEVEITEMSAKGPEGRVIAILRRSRTHLACIVLEKEASHYIGYAPLLGQQKQVRIKTLKKEKLSSGDRVICQVEDWNSESGIEAVLVRRIGSIADPSCDVVAAIEEFGLPDGFTKEAIEEAASFGTKVASLSKERIDLAELVCVTIDPDTAKDYDDAISLDVDHQGHFLLGVHIADVAYYVKPGTHLDQEAYARCNSTYFPGYCLPMLPKELSNELCSLKPNVKRLTVSVLARFDAQGNLLNHRIERTCIKSRKRFTYKEAFAVLQEKKKSVYRPLLERMVQLCHLLKQKRSERGSIDFAMSEGVVIVDEKGVPQRIEHVEYDITHQMIEEFMLKANEIVARHLQQQGKKLIYRVHAEPQTEAFEDFYAYARALGFTLPAKPTLQDLQRLFESAKESPLIERLSVSFIRSMKTAVYSSDNAGHFGLALEHYCHFTSPIRRYTDLVIGRLLFNEEDKAQDVDEVARVCSEKERLSMKAENSVVLLKKLRLAAACHEAEPGKIFAATITRLKPFALFFEVPDFALESSLHISEIGNDYYEYNAASLSFRGSRTGKVFSVGDQIFLKLQSVDLIRQIAVWKMASTPAAKQKKKRGRGS